MIAGAKACAGVLALTGLMACTSYVAAGDAHRGPVTGLAVGPATSLACSQHWIELRADLRRWLPVPSGRAVAAAVLGGQFVVGGGVPAREGWLRVLSAAGVWSDEVIVEGDVFGTVAASADGTVATGSADGAVWLWRPGTGAVPRTVGSHDGACRAVAFLSSTVLLSAGRDGRIAMIEWATGRSRELLDHTDGVECLAVAGDGTFASGARDGRVRVHDRDGRLVRTWQRLGGTVAALLEHDAGWLCGMDDGRLLLLRPGRESAELVGDVAEPIHALARDGGELLLGTQTRVLRRPWPVAVAVVGGGE